VVGPPVLTWQARASRRRPPDDGAPGVAGELSRPGRGPVTLPSPDNLADHPAIVILSRRTGDDGRVFKAAEVAFQRADDTAVPLDLAVPAPLFSVGA
jgi:hypothetical protein